MKHLSKALLLLLALFLPAIASAHDFEVDGIYYNINGNNATVTYRGSYSNSYSNEYSGDVTIPSTVSNNGIFYSVTSIGSSAFSSCSGLTSVNIPNSVTSIGSSAFSGCSGLTSVNIPNSVTSIGSSAFSGCTGLTSVTIGNAVTSIGTSVFHGCTGLTSITVESGNSTFDSRDNCNAIIETASNTLVFGCKNTTIPNSITSIGNSAFSGCSGLTNVNIPNSVTSIGYEAFCYCSGMTGVTIGNSVTSIGDRAFCGCTELTSINIPNSVAYIGYSAFYGCSGLTTINIPNSVTTIGGSAFSGCSGLTSVNIGNSVTSIGNSVTSIGNSVFYGCTGLTSITVESGNSTFDSRDNCNAIIETASNTLVFGCKNTTIPNSITSIGNSAFFGCSGLSSIDIPNSVTSIGSSAFYGCSGLINISFPNTLASMGSWAFQNTAWFNNQPDGVVYAGLFAIDYKGDMPNGIIILDEGTRGIADFAFGTMEQEKKGDHSPSLGYRPDLISIIIPNSVTIIGNYAFEQCRNLTSVYIGNSVTTIGNGAFSECPNLTSVYCFGSIPPICEGNWTFSDYSYSAILHVPAASLAAYFTAPCWSNFENIVGDAVAPSGITITQDSVDIQLGEQLQLNASVTPTNASCKEIFWTSSDDAVATVENGMVTAVGNGECDIIASCFGMETVCHVSVFNRISIDQQEVLLLPNHIITLTPTAPVMPEGFVATSSDPTVAATRVMNGKVQIVGITEGTTTITVQAIDGTASPATCLVTVYTEAGDLNRDGFTNMDDLTVMINYLLTGNDEGISLTNADVNGSTDVSMDDLTVLINFLLTNQWP